MKKFLAVSALALGSVSVVAACDDPTKAMLGCDQQPTVLMQSGGVYAFCSRIEGSGYFMQVIHWCGSTPVGGNRVTTDGTMSYARGCRWGEGPSHGAEVRVELLP